MSHAARSTCLAIFVVCAVLPGGRWAFAQVPSDAPPVPSPIDECRKCHSCDGPTPEDACLISPCTRDRSKNGHLEPDTAGVPDVVVMNELENLYLPVPFDHKGHATMAQMGARCETCHHYSPEGQPHPACKTCHAITANGTDVLRPGLKGAYHQQCLNCHREWMDERSCELCHRAKLGGEGPVGPLGCPSPGDILGRMHPPIDAPQGELFTAWKSGEHDTQVVFRHNEHVERFGLKCVECHQESSCARCHAKEKEQRPERTLVEHHRPCVRCHGGDMEGPTMDASGCRRCHWKEGQPKPPPFDHATTGWALSRYHADLSCRTCHQQVPFAARSRDCRQCHAAWSPDSFDHAVTGQSLDDRHAKIDCEDCHAERRFDVAPTCEECHDVDDDGIAFPQKRPGPRVTPPSDDKEL